MEWCGEKMGEVSGMPHETRVVQSKNHVEVKSEGFSIIVDLFDTPGLSTHEELWDYYRHFLWSGLDAHSADKRLEEARKGIAKTLALLNDLDALVLVLDLSKDPSKQISDILLDILAKRHIPLIIAANKMDLVEGLPPADDYTFLGYPVVPISALDGLNMERLYKAMYRHLKKQV